MIWVQITQLRFLLLALPRVLARTIRTLAVLGYEGEQVEGTADGGEAEESKGEGVSLDVLGGITGHDAEGGDGYSTGTEANLKGGTNASP